MGRNISHQEFTFKSYTVTTLVCLRLTLPFPPFLQASSWRTKEFLVYLDFTYLDSSFLKSELMSFWGKEKDMSSTINGSSWPVFSAWTIISSPAFTEKLCAMHINGLLWPAQQVGIESGQPHSLGKRH